MMHAPSLSLARRLSQAKMMCIVSGVAISLLLISAVIFVPIFQWRNAQPVVNVWHQSGMAISTQSMSLRIAALLDRAPAPNAIESIQQYLSHTLISRPKVLAIVLRDDQNNSRAMAASDTGRSILSDLEAKAKLRSNSEPVQRMTLGKHSIWIVSQSLAAQTHENWKLEVLYTANDDVRLEQDLIRNSVLATLIGVCILILLMHRIWKLQIATPFNQWTNLGQRAASGIWESQLTQRVPHPLTRASHAVVQRVQKRAQWLAWQHKKFASDATSAPRFGRPD